MQINAIKHEHIEALNESGIEVRQNCPLASRTTFGVGGPAEAYIEIKSTVQLRQVFDIIRDEDYEWFILGNGTNLLVSDEGVPGFVLRLTGDFKTYQRHGDSLIVGGGHGIIRLAHAAIQEGLSGFEFASAIPGSVGGGVRMNSGIGEREMKDCVYQVETFDPSFGALRVRTDDFGWKYRRSAIADSGEIVTRVWFKLDDDEPEAIRKRVEEHMEYRRQNQPYGQRSAGSVFKNPEGKSAWKLIDECGLRGKRVGGAFVSDKHSNWILADAGCTARNIFELQELIIEEVFKKFGVRLEREQELVGAFT